MAESGAKAIGPRPDSARPVQRFLPAAYRKGGRGTALHALTRALSQGLDRVDQDLEAAFKAHFLEQLTDIGDATRLAALLDEVPWRDETLAGFRARVRRYAALVLAGGASAARLLELVAVATGAEVRERFGPRQTLTSETLPGVTLQADRFSVAAVLEKAPPLPDDAPSGTEPELGHFVVRIEDHPLQAFSQRIRPEGGRTGWVVVNDAPFEPPDPFAKPGTPGADEPRADHPRLVITAGEHPLSAPVVLQHEARRAVLINRLLPPGCQLQLDLTDPTAPALLEDTPGTLSQPGPVRTDAGAAPLLYFGTGAVLDLSRFSAAGATPAHWCRWYPAEAIDPVARIAEAELPPQTAAPARLPWPPLVPEGRSGWTLLAADWCADAGPVPLDRLRFRQTAANAPAEVVLHWRGRLPGTFAVRFDRRWCSPAGAEPVPERVEWLDARIRRLSLAGTLYLTPDQVAPTTTSGLPAGSSETEPATSDPADSEPKDTGAEDQLPTPPTGAERAVAGRAGLLLGDALAIDSRPPSASPMLPDDGLRRGADDALLGRAALRPLDRLDVRITAPPEPARVELPEPLALGDRLSLQHRRAARHDRALATTLTLGDHFAFEHRRRDDP